MCDCCYALCLLVAFFLLATGERPIAVVGEGFLVCCCAVVVYFRGTEYQLRLDFSAHHQPTLIPSASPRQVCRVGPHLAAHCTHLPNPYLACPPFASSCWSGRSRWQLYRSGSRTEAISVRVWSSTLGLNFPCFVVYFVASPWIALHPLRVSSASFSSRNSRLQFSTQTWLALFSTSPLALCLSAHFSSCGSPADLPV